MALESKTESTLEKLKELRRKIHLSEGHRKAIYEDGENSKRENERKICELQNDISELQLKLKRESQLSEKAYQRALQDKRISMIIRNKRPQDVKVDFQEKVFALQRKLDDLRHQQERKAQTLATLLESGYSQKKYSSNPSELTLNTQIRQLENKDEKLKAKVIEARYVNQHYQNIVDKLKADQCIFSHELMRIEKDLLSYYKEMKHIKQLEQYAINLRNTVIEDISYFENKIKRLETQFESKVVIKEQEKNQEQAIIYQALNKKTLPHSTRMWQDLLTQVKDPVRLKAEERELLALLQFFDFIKEHTGIVSLQELYLRTKSQQRTSKYLQHRHEVAQQRLVQLQEEKDELETKCQELKYTESQKYAETFSLLKKYQEVFEEQDEKLKENEKKLEETSSAVHTVRASLEEMVQKLKDIDGFLPVPTPSASDTYILQLLDFCLERLSSIGEQSDTYDLNFLLSKYQVPSNVIFVHEKPEEEIIEGEDINLDMENLSKFPSRKYIKQVSMQILETQAKKKKQMYDDTPRRRKGFRKTKSKI